jgi:hypothetical protein
MQTSGRACSSMHTVNVDVERSKMQEESKHGKAALE